MDKFQEDAGEGVAIQRKHIGTAGELKAAVWLLEQGYEVFKNVSPYGLIDMIAVKGDEILKLDVKYSTTSCPSTPLSDAQKQQGVKLLTIWNGDNFEICTEPPTHRRTRSEKLCKICGNTFIAINHLRRRCDKCIAAPLESPYSADQGIIVYNLKPYKKPCVACGGMFAPLRGYQRTCDKCQAAAPRLREQNSITRQNEREQNRQRRNARAKEKIVKRKSEHCLGKEN